MKAKSTANRPYDRYANSAVLAPFHAALGNKPSSFGAYSPEKDRAAKLLAMKADGLDTAEKRVAYESDFYAKCVACGYY